MAYSAHLVISYIIIYNCIYESNLWICTRNMPLKKYHTIMDKIYRAKVVFNRKSDILLWTFFRIFNQLFDLLYKYFSFRIKGIHHSFVAIDEIIIISAVPFLKQSGKCVVRRYRQFPFGDKMQSKHSLYPTMCLGWYVMFKKQEELLDAYKIQR